MLFIIIISKIIKVSSNMYNFDLIVFSGTFHNIIYTHLQVPTYEYTVIIILSNKITIYLHENTQIHFRITLQVVPCHYQSQVHMYCVIFKLLT